MVKLKCNTKLKASTLAEVTVALTIIAIISGMAMMILVSISKTSNHQLKILAFIELEKIITEVKHSGEPENEDFESDNFIIEQNVSDYRKSINLKEVHYKVYSKQKKLLFERFELIELNTNKETENLASEFEF